METDTLIIDDIIVRGLKEDIGTGDITSFSIIPADLTARGFMLAKEDGVLAGINVAERVFFLLSPDIRFKPLKKDGDCLRVGDIIAEIEGSARLLLAGERLALNLLQRMSGIATRTRRVADKLKGYKTVVVDTRKTSPGLRVLEKYAVTVGGGRNHRFGLYDGVLIKDNHIKVAGGIEKAVTRAKENVPHTIKIEVEVESLAGVQEALAAGADIIMLDNMDLAQVKEAIAMIDGKALVEVSGGITEERIDELSSLGVDIISMGALTHSVKALDISLDVGYIKEIK